MPAKSKKRRGEDDLKEHALIESTVKDLLAHMDEAFNADREANKEKKPAFKRLSLLEKIDKTLRKIMIHEEFLHMQGCLHLYNWLLQMPDGTYPN